MLSEFSGRAGWALQHHTGLRHGRGNDAWIVGFARESLMEKVAAGAPCLQSGLHRDGAAMARS